jgi:hypothetical protein
MTLYPTVYPTLPKFLSFLTVRSWCSWQKLFLLDSWTINAVTNRRPPPLVEALAIMNSKSEPFLSPHKIVFWLFNGQHSVRLSVGHIDRAVYSRQGRIYDTRPSYRAQYRAAKVRNWEMFNRYPTADNCLQLKVFSVYWLVYANLKEKL